MNGSSSPGRASNSPRAPKVNREGERPREPRPSCGELFEKQSDTVVKLRAFWTLYCIGAAEEPFLRAQLRHPNEHVRTWAIRFLTDTWPLDTVMSPEAPWGKLNRALWPRLLR